MAAATCVIPEPTPSVDLSSLTSLRSHSRAAATLNDDSLTTYMNQIRRVQVLPRETQDELARAHAEGDLEAGKALIWSNLRLVIKLARDAHRSNLDLMELIQEGNLGLCEALIRFDPDRGTPFVGYAHFWIRAMIMNHLLTMSRPMRMGSSRDGRKLFFNLKKARRALRRDGLEPTAENVAEYLDVDEDEVHRLGSLMDGGGVVYLDAPAFDDDGDTRNVDLLPGSFDAPDDIAEERIMKERLQELAAAFHDSLPDARRQSIWERRMVALEPEELKELGAHFGISKERVRQLEMDIRRRFRHFLEDSLGEDAQYL